MGNEKRINMYFNLEDPDDCLIFDYLSKRSKRGPFAKEILYNFVSGLNLNVSQQKMNITQPGLTDEQLNSLVAQRQFQELQEKLRREKEEAEKKPTFSAAEVENISLE